MAKEFNYLSLKYGTHLDWFPAGGGNISVKDGNILYVKQSGTAVCDSKFVKCDLHKLLNNFYDDNENLTDCILSSGIPSIEVWFHSFTKKYTIHMHPSELCTILCSNEKIHLDKYENIKYLFIDYFNPGKEVSMEIYKTYDNHSVIFLKNHGVIFTSDSLRELHDNIAYVLKSCKQNIFDLQMLTNKNIWKSRKLINIGKLNIYIPDIVIYLGFEVTKSTYEEIQRYIKEYDKHPVLIRDADDLYIVADTKRKYYDIEEMIDTYLNFHVSAKTTLNKNNIKLLTESDREKYRQNI
jgi:ribulose-5-phosphate 4-epimerase/fuculose-1-phosphate aldolase